MVFFKDLFEKYNYYEKPEGQDPVNKIMGLAKYGMLCGTVMASYDAILISSCKTAGQVLNTAGYWMLPMTGMCVAFSSVTYLATNARHKDDGFNYALGVMASGTVMHLWLRDYHRSGFGTFILLIYALLKKEYEKNPNHGPLILPNKPITTQVLPWKNVPYRVYNRDSSFKHEIDYYK